MKNDPRRSFWRAAGPLLGFWGIQLVMEFVIEFIIILPFMGGSIFQDDTKWRSS
mgnify:CR=1 FL=1